MSEFKLNKYKLEHLFSYSVSVDANMDFMKGMPLGTRLTGYITGGEVWGPKLNGKILPVGADWSYVRKHGIVDIDCRTMIEAENGDHIYMTYTGRIDLGSEEAAVDYLILARKKQLLIILMANFLRLWVIKPYLYWKPIAKFMIGQIV